LRCIASTTWSIRITAISMNDTWQTIYLYTKARKRIITKDSILGKRVLQPFVYIKIARHYNEANA